MGNKDAKKSHIKKGEGVTNTHKSKSESTKVETIKTPKYR
jgi:hypothetical protein